MNDYTQMLESLQPDIAFEYDDYREGLITSVRSFRSFDESLDSFLAERGYAGDPDRTEDKIRFIRSACRAAGVPEPRNMARWYEKHAEIRRDTAFQLAFAFSLNVEETDDFFRRVFLDRSFDFHSYDELVWFFCIRNRIPYAEGLAAIREIGERYDIRRGTVSSGDIIYTGAIFREVRDIRSLEELKEYICANIRQFEYNNATATAIIRRLWNEISGSDGLAAGEYRAMALSGSGDGTDRDPTAGLVSDTDAFRMIVGVDRDTLRGLSPDGRSLSPAFRENVIVHSLTARSFPSRLGINKIINGQPTENETVRKTLILLSFYSFWARKALARSRDIYTAGPNDLDRCVAEINSHLLQANYPELYSGNPYDWVILWACQAPEPLPEFRYYIREVIEAKKEMTEKN